MTKKSRRIIFYTFVFLFFIIAVSVVLYAQGYIFDWKNKRLIAGGAIYLKSQPKEAEIYLNEEFQGKTDEFIKRLLPAVYSIKIFKPGYWEWQKNLEVKSKLVTEAKNILLIKKELLLGQVTNFNVKYCSISNNQDRLLYLTDRSVKEVNPLTQKIADPDRILTESKYALRVFDLLDNNDIQVYPYINQAGIQETIPSLAHLSDIVWSPDDSKIILNIEGKDFYLLDLENNFQVINLKKLIQLLSGYKIFSPYDFSFYPQDTNKLLFVSNQDLYLLNLERDDLLKSKLTGPVIFNVLSYKIYNNNIYLIDTSPSKTFYEVDLSFSSFKKIFNIPFLNPKKENISIATKEVLIINGALYLYTEQTKELKKITDYVTKIELSPDKKKLLWQAPKEIGIIWLDPDPKQQPFREKNQVVFLVKTFKEIKDATWLSETNEHVIFIVDNEVKIVELDNRDKVNIMNIHSFEKDFPKELFYSKENNFLYILSLNNKLSKVRLIEK